MPTSYPKQIRFWHFQICDRFRILFRSIITFRVCFSTWTFLSPVIYKFRGILNQLIQWNWRQVSYNNYYELMVWWYELQIIHTQFCQIFVSCCTFLSFLCRGNIWIHPINLFFYSIIDTQTQKSCRHATVLFCICSRQAAKMQWLSITNDILGIAIRT